MREISSPFGQLSPFGRRADLLNATAIARLLFSDNEPGFFYDFDDWSTLFQDTAGTQPVTAANQGVALALDKRLGLELGPELVTNGGFDEGISGWSVVGSSTTKQVTWTGSALELSASTTGTCVASGDITPLVSGRTYQVSGDCLLYTESLSGVFFGDGAQSVGVIGGVGKFRFIVTAGAGHSKINFGRVSAGVNTLVQLQVDNISVRELKGNHATQATTAARPLTVIHPDGGVRNLLDRTEEFDNAYWAVSNATKVNAGTSVRIVPNSAATNGHLFTSNTTLNNNGLLTQIAVESRPAGADWLHIGRAGAGIWVNVNTGALGGNNFSAGENPVASVSDPDADGWRAVIVSFTELLVPNGSATQIRFYPSVDTPTTGGPASGGGNDGVAGVEVRRPQWQIGTGPYQKRVNFLDVTEAGKRSIRRLYFNGTSHFMTTPTITPNTDKAQVFAGVRKLSDAAVGVVCELSATASFQTNGALGVYAPNIATQANYNFISRGTSFAQSVSPASFAAPISNVLTGLGDISGDLATLRLNGTQVAQSTADQGTGNYLAYQMFIGARGGTSNFYNGYLDQLITRFGANLDSGAIETTEKYVSTKVPELVAASEVTWNASTDTYTQNLVGLGR
jgi:hypothetical protein